jgi:O-acetylhomoserine/O-acetylserine sulfhydrylase-like pyridoxal-dependent enzyme
VRDLRKAGGHRYPLAGGPAVSVLERRLKALEAAVGVMAAAKGAAGCW